jgi:hypothetical protein
LVLARSEHDTILAQHSFADLLSPESPHQQRRPTMFHPFRQRGARQHAGTHSFDMAKSIRAVAISQLLDELKPW